MQATIDKKQLNELIGNLRSMGEKVSDAVFDEVQAAALDIESEAKKNLKANKSIISARLVTSVKSLWDRKTFAAAVFTDVEYAPYVEFGAPAHEIKAVNAKALKIPVGKGFIFRKSVMHPGSMAKPFLYPAWFAGIGRLWNNLNNVMKNVEGDK